MKIRLVLTGILAVVLLSALGTAAPAQQTRVIKVSLAAYRFEPSVVTVNQGERIILQLENTDPEHKHSIASPYLSTTDVLVRGDAKLDTTSEGWKTVLVEPGKQANVEFVAHGRGQDVFICSVANHASLGMTGAFVIWPPGFPSAAPRGATPSRGY